MARPKAPGRSGESSDGSLSLDAIKKLCTSILNRHLWNRWSGRLQVKARCSVNHRIGYFQNGKPKFKKMFKCEKCSSIVDHIDVNHIIPRISEEGFETLDIWVERTFVEADKLEGLCKACHVKETAKQSAARALRRKEKKSSEGIRTSTHTPQPKRPKRSSSKTDSGESI